MSENSYQPATVWKWDPEAKGNGAKTNRPVAGATHETALPVGKHPLQLYSLGTPNGQKVTILLEELLAVGVKEAEYDAWLIRIGDGDQFGSDRGVQIRAAETGRALKAAILVKHDALGDERDPGQIVSEAGCGAAIFGKMHHGDAPPQTDR